MPIRTPERRQTWASRSRNCPTIKWRVPASRLTEIRHARFGGVPRSVSVPLLVPCRTNRLFEIPTPEAAAEILYPLHPVPFGQDGQFNGAPERKNDARATDDEKDATDDEDDDDVHEDRHATDPDAPTPAMINPRSTTSAGYAYPAHSIAIMAAIIFAANAMLWIEATSSSPTPQRSATNFA